MKKSFISPVLVFILFFISISFISACSYGNHTDCEVTKNIVEGRVYYADTNQSAGNADVTVICYHNEESNFRTTKTLSSGPFEGGYLVLFELSECVTGDEVLVNAVKGGLSGSGEGVLEDLITTPCINIDLAVVNVPLVPEFGIIVGALTLLGAIGIFFVIRRK